MNNEEIISDFIEYNATILNEIKATPELSSAVGAVIQEIFKKYVGVEVQVSEETGEIERPTNQYSVGEMVETISFKWVGVAVIEKAVYDKKEDSWIYYVKQGSIKFPELEANLYAANTEQVVETEYSTLTDKALLKKLADMKAYKNMLDEEDDEADIIEADTTIEQLEMEIENRNLN
jgi:hypothetical protein